MDYLCSYVQNIQRETEREREESGGGGREIKRQEEVRQGRCLEHSKL